MPGAIGAGAFWSEMTAFANGQDAKTTGDNIQAAWFNGQSGFSR